MILHMKKPVWVWVYDYGPNNYPDNWPPDTEVKAYPQAHTYAFENKEDAEEHPTNMKWEKNHPYILQKVYLN